MANNENITLTNLQCSPFSGLLHTSRLLWSSHVLCCRVRSLSPLLWYLRLYLSALKIHLIWQYRAKQSNVNTNVLNSILTVGLLTVKVNDWRSHRVLPFQWLEQKVKDLKWRGSSNKNRCHLSLHTGPTLLWRKTSQELGNLKIHSYSH